jgi:hypothetical protein
MAAPKTPATSQRCSSVAKPSDHATSPIGIFRSYFGYQLFETVVPVRGQLVKCSLTYKIRYRKYEAVRFRVALVADPTFIGLGLALLLCSRRGTRSDAYVQTRTCPSVVPFVLASPVKCSRRRDRTVSTALFAGHGRSGDLMNRERWLRA